MGRKIVIAVVLIALLGGAFLGYHVYQERKKSKTVAGTGMPPIPVSAMRAAFQTWLPQIKAVGSLRAVRGTDVTSEITGMVRGVQFRSGDEVKEGQELIQLNADADIAQLHALEAAAELAAVVMERDRKQFAVQAVSQAQLDADTADLKSKRAQVAAQAAIVAKKTIRAPFAGKLGISTVNPGQYINPGDKIVNIQAIDALYADFYLPQQELSRIALDQKVTLVTDSRPGRIFAGRLSAVNPIVDQNTRNFLVEATIANRGHELLPGMYVSLTIQAGRAQRFLTLPQTAVTFNPYGDTVFLILETGKGPGGKAILTARQTFVTVGETRGDQIAIIKGIKEGDMVVTSGQFKLKNGSVVVINNQVQPTNESNPKPVDE